MPGHPDTMRILVVEDERKVASFIRQGLAEEGYAVDVATDGAAALDLALGGTSYDLIVLDVMLPKRDGFAVLRALRDHRMAAPVLLLTARDSVPDKVAGLDLGADDYLTKPFAFDEFLARVPSFGAAPHSDPRFSSSWISGWIPRHARSRGGTARSR